MSKHDRIIFHTCRTLGYALAAANIWNAIANSPWYLLIAAGCAGLAYISHRALQPESTT